MFDKISFFASLEALARRGHAVSLLNQTTMSGMYRGVQCLSLHLPVSRSFIAEQDAVIALSSGLLSDLKSQLPAACPFVLWAHHDIDQSAAQPLAVSAERDSWDGFVFVSCWQQERYIAHFHINPARAAIIRNAVGPCFYDLTDSPNIVLTGKPMHPVLAYTSTPFRGLDVALATFPLVRRVFPLAELKVFSSMQVYQIDSAADPFADLYDVCRKSDGIKYCGSVSQPELARSLAKSTMLYYPNTFSETACIAALEAMAAGCLVISSDRAALPETCAGFGRLVPPDDDTVIFCKRFIEATTASLREWSQNPYGVSRYLQMQMDFVRREYSWSRRAEQWEDYLAGLVRG